MEGLDHIIRAYDKNIVLREKQREALEYLASKKGDLVVSLPVGYGKSIIFHLLPQILGENTTKPVVLVISPLNIAAVPCDPSLWFRATGRSVYSQCSKISRFVSRSLGFVVRKMQGLP